MGINWVYSKSYYRKCLKKYKRLQFYFEIVTIGRIYEKRKQNLGYLWRQNHKFRFQR